MKIVYLTPRSSYRNNLRSDTLWGLICWGIKTVYSEKELEEFLDEYNENPPLKISSAFYFLQKEENKKELFFPKPQLKPLNLNEYFENNGISSKKERAEKISKLKKYKKIRFVPEPDFFSFLKGEFNEENYFHNGKWEEILRNATLYKEEDILHNTIDRLTNTTPQSGKEQSLFIRTEYFINKKGGLFFLAEGSDRALHLMNGALRFLSHVGFGGDATIGKNSFKVEIADYSLPVIENANSFLTLSLYMPTNEETELYEKNKNNVWYQLETRKGKFGGQFIKQKRFWKDSVLMFSEGSIFPASGKENYGQNKIVLPKSENGNFDVFQYGYAFNLPIKVK